MKSVVYIGFYNKSGQFENDPWDSFINWITKKCDNVQIYTPVEYSNILDYFGNSGEVIQQVFPDVSLNYNSFKIVCRNDEFWVKIKNASFNIDNGITHMYFYGGDIFIGELEADDCENFLFLDISQSEAHELASMIPNSSKNIQSCKNRKEQIDYTINGENWIPIGEE